MRMRLAKQPNPFPTPPRVCAQLAYSVGEWNSPVAGKILGRLAKRSSGEPDLLTAIASSATDHSVVHPQRTDQRRRHRFARITHRHRRPGRGRGVRRRD